MGGYMKSTLFRLLSLFLTSILAVGQLTAVGCRSQAPHSALTKAYLARRAQVKASAFRQRGAAQLATPTVSKKASRPIVPIGPQKPEEVAAEEGTENTGFFSKFFSFLMSPKGLLSLGGLITLFLTGKKLLDNYRASAQGPQPAPAPVAPGPNTNNNQVVPAPAPAPVPTIVVTPPADPVPPVEPVAPAPPAEPIAVPAAQEPIAPAVEQPVIIPILIPAPAEEPEPVAGPSLPPVMAQVRGARIWEPNGSEIPASTHGKDPVHFPINPDHRNVASGNNVASVNPAHQNTDPRNLQVQPFFRYPLRSANTQIFPLRRSPVQTGVPSFSRAFNVPPIRNLGSNLRPTAAASMPPVSRGSSVAQAATTQAAEQAAGPSLTASNNLRVQLPQTPQPLGNLNPDIMQRATQIMPPVPPVPQAPISTAQSLLQRATRVMPQFLNQIKKTK